VEVCFRALAGQPSGLVTLEIADAQAIKANGEPLGNSAGRPGLAAVVGEEPLLECVHGAGGVPVLLLYGQPGGGYGLQGTADLLAGEWQTLRTGLTVPSGLVLELALPGGSPGSYYRALRVE
jgi:hypothetical protein